MRGRQRERGEGAGPLDALVALIREGLEAFFRWTGNYGLAIILLTVAVRVLLLPLTLAQMRQVQKMQELQPELQRLQRKYRDNPQRLNEETWKLWRERGVSPLAGCLPVLIQLPILWAFFHALSTFRFDGRAGFLWVDNLAAPDPWYVLPLLAAVTTYWQSVTAVSPQGADPTQRVMAYFFPFLVGGMAVKLPSGLALYWVVSNVLSVVQQRLLTSGQAVRPAKGDA